MLGSFNFGLPSDRGDAFAAAAKTPWPWGTLPGKCAATGAAEKSNGSLLGSRTMSQCAEKNFSSWSTKSNSVFTDDAASDSFL